LLRLLLSLGITGAATKALLVAPDLQPETKPVSVMASLGVWHLRAGGREHV